MKRLDEFIPKSYLYLRNGYSFSTFKKDLVAGITVGVIALPLAMAFGIASGVDPARGLFTAIVAGFLISLLGGSRVQIGGPTGAFVVIVYDIVQRTGYEGLAASTLIASIILVLLALFRLGSWIKYVPHPLVTGFTTGIALLIFSSQIKDFFGLPMGTPSPDFLEKWSQYAAIFPDLHIPTFALGSGTLGLILIIRRFAPKLPWGISAIIVATLIAYLFDLSTPTVASKFGQIPHLLPLPSIPSFNGLSGRFSEIMNDAFAIAFLGAIESLLSCVIGDGMIGGRHKSNCELLAQGVANFGSIIFGGIPATGAIARTAANVKTGAQTPLAGMIHAVTLFLIILFASPLVSQIPLASLSAVLMMVAWNMSEANHFIRLFRAPVGDIAILLTAFFLTVFVDITMAITVGMVLASLLFMKRMSDFSKVISLDQIFEEEPGEFPERSDPESLDRKKIPSHVAVYEIQGPLFFGAADMLKDLNDLSARILILRMRHVPIIDSSGMHALKDFFSKCQKSKTTLLLSGIGEANKGILRQFGLADQIGEANMFPHIDAALTHAASMLKQEL